MSDEYTVGRKYWRGLGATLAVLGLTGIILSFKGIKSINHEYNQNLIEKTRIEQKYNNMPKLLRTFKERDLYLTLREYDQNKEKYSLCSEQIIADRENYAQSKQFVEKDYSFGKMLCLGWGALCALTMGLGIRSLITGKK